MEGRKKERRRKKSALYGHRGGRQTSVICQAFSLLYRRGRAGACGSITICLSERYNSMKEGRKERHVVRKEEIVW